MQSDIAARDHRSASQPLRRTLLAPGRVRELSQLRPWRAVRDTAICWAVIVAAWIAGAAVGTWWSVLLAAAVVGNRYYALFIIGHDGLHRRLFSRSETSDLFNDVFVLAPIGAITRINNRNHLQHHQHLATRADPDRHKHGCFNKATRLALLGYLTAATSVWRTVSNVMRSDGSVPKGGLRRYRTRDLALIGIWQAGLLVGLTLLYGWWGYLLLWWVPVFALTFLADNLRTFVEHSHPESDERADAHRLVSFTPSRFEGALFAPMNMNFHAAHHLWPSIPYYNLPTADAEMRAAPGSEVVTWRRSYLGYIWRYARALPVEGCPPVLVDADA